MKNLYRFKNILFDSYTVKGTIKHAKFDVPNGYSISNVIVTGRIQISNLAGLNYLNYKTTETNFSYTYDNNGNVWISNIENTESADRLAEIFIVFTKS